MTSISEERAAFRRFGLDIRLRSDWAARFNYNTVRSVTEPADHVFVHISVTNPSAYSSSDAHARALESIGISRFPNTGVSYNRGVTPDATLYELQPIGRRGAHTLNDKRLARCQTPGCPGNGASLTAPSYNLNVNARAYVIMQNVRDTVSHAQIEVMAKAIAFDMLAGYVKRNAHIHGHRCVSAKDCPGSLMWALMGRLRDRVDYYLQRGSITEDQTGDWFDMATEKQLRDAVRAVLGEPAVLNALAVAVWNVKNSVSDETHSRMLRLAPERAAVSTWTRKNPETDRTYGFMDRRLFQGGEPVIISADGNRWSWRYALERLWRRLYGVPSSISKVQATIDQVAAAYGLTAQQLEDAIGQVLSAEPAEPTSVTVEQLDGPAEGSDDEVQAEDAALLPSDVDEVSAEGSAG